MTSTSCAVPHLHLLSGPSGMPDYTPLRIGKRGAPVGIQLNGRSFVSVLGLLSRLCLGACLVVRPCVRFFNLTILVHLYHFLPRLASRPPSRPERKGLIPPLDLTGDSQTTDAHAAAARGPRFSFFYGSEGGVATGSSPFLSVYCT